MATAAELSAAAKGFKVERLIVAFECGAIVNPDGLNNQVEGAVVQGLGGALFEAIEFANGQLSNGSMAQYRCRGSRTSRPSRSCCSIAGPPVGGRRGDADVCVAPAIGSAARNLGSVATELPVKLV